MTKRDKPVDWASIETDYCRTATSVREMARWHGITEAAIRKKAKQMGWVRQCEPAHIAREPVSARAQPVDDTGETVTEKAKGLAGRMLNELDAVTSLHGELEDMICTEESDPRRRQALLKSISLGERVNVLKNLSNALKTLNEAGQPDGKKAQRQKDAEEVASGRFAPRSGPRLAVNNG